MSNCSVKLSKWKMAIQLGSPAKRGAECEANLRGDLPDPGRAWAGAVSAGLGGGLHGDPGTRAAVGTPWLGPREGEAAPDQMARLLNY